MKELKEIERRLAGIESTLRVLLRAQAWAPVHDAHAQRKRVTGIDDDGEFTGHVFSITRSGFVLSSGAATPGEVLTTTPEPGEVTRAFAWGDAAVIDPPFVRPLVDTVVAP